MQTYLGGFKHFIILTLFGKMFQFDSYYSDRQLDDLKNPHGLNMLTSADGKLAGAGGEDCGDKAVDGAVSTRFGSSGDLFWKARCLLVCMKLEQCNMKLQLCWVRPIVSCWDKGIFVRKTNQLDPLRPLRTKHLIYIYICFLLVWVTKMMRDWSGSPMNQSKNLCFSQPLKPPKQFTLITLTAEVNDFPGIEGLESQPKKGPSFNQLGVLQNNGTPKMTMNQIKTVSNFGFEQRGIATIL